MSGELKPCPFCGRENIRIGYYEPYEHAVRLFYYCNSCGARCGDQNSDERLAIAAWNTRAQLPESPTTGDKAGEGTNTSETANEPPESVTGSESGIILPEPCTNVGERTVKDWFAKIDEELNELKEQVLYERCLHGKIKVDCKADNPVIAEEAADTITAITSMLEAMGITLAERQEAQRRVNARNKERGRL